MSEVAVSDKGTAIRLSRFEYVGQPIQSIQALRAVAAVMVVIHHASIMAGSLLGSAWSWGNGAAGVDIFFVVSGFVISLSALPSHGRPVPAGRFLVRRLKRLVPLYWIMTTIQLALTFFVPSFTSDTRGDGAHVLGAYLFFPTLYRGSITPVLAVGWTLNFEMLFYLVMTAALALKISQPLRLLLPVMLSLAFVSPWAARSHWGVLMLANPMVLEFLFGAIIANAMMRGRVMTPLISMMAISFACITILMVEFHHGAPRCVVWGVPAALLVAGCVGLGNSLARHIPVWVLDLGNSSYSLYLVHTVLLSIIGGCALRWHFNTQGDVSLLAVFGVLLSVGVGEIVYRFVERPLLAKRTGDAPARVFAGVRPVGAPNV